MFDKLKSIFWHIVPVGWYCVSAGVNFNGGMILFQSLGFTAQMLAGCALLVVQFSLPYYECTERLTGENHSLGKVLSWLVTMFCLFLTISSALSTSVSNQILTGSTLLSKEISVGADKLLLDNVDIIDETTFKSNDVAITTIDKDIRQIQSTIALNFAGDIVYKDNKKQTMWSITNGCTNNNVYMINTKLYKTHCDRIKSLEVQKSSLQTINSKKNHRLAVDKSVKLKDEISQKTKEIGENVAGLFNTDIVVDYIAEGVDFSNTDSKYILSNKTQIKERSMFIAALISLVGMFIEVGLMKAFISHFIDKNKVKRSFRFRNPPPAIFNIVKLPFSIYKNKTYSVAPTKDSIKIQFDAVERMRKLNISTIKELQNFINLDSGRGIVDVNEIITLQLAVSHLYFAGEHIPLKSTIDTTKDKLLNDVEYNKLISHNGKQLTKDYIDKICKTNRLKKFYFDVFENILIEKKQGKYYWMSEKDIELSFNRSNLT